jgi:hypothetical protein
MVARAWSQGDDNGLCGLYAAVNAIRWLVPELRKQNKRGDERIAPLLPYLVRQMRPEEFQQLYLDGDELALVNTVLFWAIAWLKIEVPQYRFRSWAPFWSQPARSERAYWATVLPLIKRRGAVAIIGFDSPWSHWTVAPSMSRPYSVRLFDSDVFKTMDVRRTSFKPQTKAGNYQLDPRAVLIVERTKA